MLTIKFYDETGRRLRQKERTNWKH